MASVLRQLNAMPGNRDTNALFPLLEELRLDLVDLRNTINTHVHSGITAGGANSGALVTPAAALRTVA